MAASISTLLAKGFELLKGGDLPASLKVFEDILTAEPTNADALWLRGVAFIQLQRFNDTIKSLERALVQRPADAAICNDLGTAHETSGDINSARTLFAKALQLDPNLAPALINIAKVELNQGNARSALDAINSAIEKQSDICEAYNIKGNALRELEQNTDALGAYDKALKIDPMNAEVLCNKGLLLHEMGKANVAEESLQQALNQSQPAGPSWANAKMTLGLIQAKRGQLHSALACFDEVLQKYPDHISSLVNRGDIHQRLEDFVQAESDFNAALTIDPKNAEALHNRGRLNLLVGQ